MSLLLFLLREDRKRSQPRSQGSLLPVPTERERERERERDPDWVWSHGSRTKLILRKESFVSQFFCPVRFHCSHNDRKGKIDLLSLQLIYRFSQG